MARLHSYGVLALLTSVLLAADTASAQIVEFYPPADTIYILGGCFPAGLMATLRNGPGGRDTISLTSPFNDPISARFPVTYEDTLTQCHFLVDDSLDQYQYELTAQYNDVPYYALPPIVFEAPFGLPPGSLTLTLHVMLNDSIVDSLGVEFQAFQTGLYVEDPTGDNLPAQCTLTQNFPNPFNGQTRVSYVLQQAVELRLEAFDLKGRRVGLLAQGQHVAGRHTVIWETDGLSSGTYVLLLSTPRESATIRCSLIK